MSTANTQHYDVIIAGARCAGAATALLLARQGARVLVLDKSRYGTDTLSTHALMRGAVLQLHRWGLLPAVTGAGTPPVRSTTFHLADGVTTIPVKPRHGVEALYAPRRIVLDAILADAARGAGADVRFGATVTGLRRDRAGRVTGITGRAGGARLEASADLVVGADGRRSAVARYVGARTVHVAPASSVLIYRYVQADTVDGYPVCMKLMASWSSPASRALAMGALIGCLALGSALPHLIDGLGRLDWRTVLAAAAATAFCAAIVAGALVRPGPQFPAGGGTRHSRYALGMFTDRGPRLVSLAYFGHMWELYALWTWLPAFLIASGTTTTGHEGASGIDAFLAIGVAGLAGCLLGGWAADRLGRAATAGAALAVSGACCLLSPLFFTASRPWLLAFTTVWGAAVIADSGVFSTMLSEVADRRYVGTALTTQTAIGFLLTIVTIQLIPLTAAVTGWRYAFLALAAGPMTALPALAALNRQIRPNGLPSTLTERTLS